MTTNHIDQLAQWYADAERITDTNLPRAGDTLIFPYNAGGYAIEAEGDDWTPGDVVPGESARILHRAPKPKPAWHDAVAVIAASTVGDQDGGGPVGRVFERVEHLGGREVVWAHGDIEYETGELCDVTPLIEAKVTDEMVKRALTEYNTDTWRFNGMARMRHALTVALGLEAK